MSFVQELVVYVCFDRVILSIKSSVEDFLDLVMEKVVPLVCFEKTRDVLEDVALNNCFKDGFFIHFQGKADQFDHF